MPVESALPSVPGSAHEHLLLPCSEACAAFRPLKPNHWSDFGLCGNPRSRFRGYPVRIGRDCRNFLVQGRVDINPAT